MSLLEFWQMCAAQVAVGLIFDRVFGDPHWFPHPARFVGSFIARAERAMRKKGGNLRAAGYLLCASTVILSSLVAAAVMFCLWSIDQAVPNVETGSILHRPFTVIGGGILCGIWFSWKSLSDEALKVEEYLSAGNLNGARAAVAMIVGRDTADLKREGISRAAVETVGENAVDGGLAPVFFALLGGPVLLTLFKAASTLDSMVGHKDERYIELGMASARFDDLLNYIPARLSLPLFALAAWVGSKFGKPFSAADAWRVGRRDCRKHESPNSAYGESAFAGALGVTIGGPARYSGEVVHKPFLGDGKGELNADTIRNACALLDIGAGICFFISVILLCVFSALR